MHGGLNSLLDIRGELPGRQLEICLKLQRQVRAADRDVGVPSVQMTVGVPRGKVMVQVPCMQSAGGPGQTRRTAKCTSWVREGTLRGLSQAGGRLRTQVQPPRKRRPSSGLHTSVIKRFVSPLSVTAFLRMTCELHESGVTVCLVSVPPSRLARGFHFTCQG